MVYGQSFVIACAVLGAVPAAAQTATSSAAIVTTTPVDAYGGPPAEAAAAPEDSAEGWGDLGEAVAKVFDTRLYGYIDAHVEQVADTPSGVGADGTTQYEANALEIDVLNLHVMVQGTILSRFRYFVNLVGSGAGSPTSDAGISVRNAWLEAPVFGDALQVRLGKTYRRFGLYNEILDAVPTFIGIEAPELFDKDHLLLTRTTNAMLHGRFGLGLGSLAWSLTTGADERATDQIPLGGDLRLVADVGLTVGSSFYWSGGDAAPSRAVGEGSPAGGVINWMERDEYYVVGGYAQYQPHGLTLQAEYWQAHHDTTRSEEATLALAEADLLPAQRGRFFVNGDPAQGLTPRDVQYDVRTFYLRAGYDVALPGELVLTPYGQLDYYANPETINAKSFGGDAEAGNTDDGEFWKFTVGAVFRPVAPVALKVDGSGHLQTYNGKSEFYPELDGKSALDLYKQYLGEEAAGLPGTALLYPLAIRRKDSPATELVRTIVDVDHVSKGLVFAGDMPEGAVAQLMRGMFDELVTGASEAAASAGTGQLAILVSCIGRKLLMGQRISDEVEAVGDVLGAACARIGYYSYGEISPHQVSGVADLHNQTMTITTFAEDPTTAEDAERGA